MILSNEIDCWWYLDEDGINKLYNFVCSEYGKLSFKKISHLIKKITRRNNEASLINERFVHSNEAISKLEHVVTYLYRKEMVREINFQSFPSIEKGNLPFFAISNLPFKLDSTFYIRDDDFCYKINDKKVFIGSADFLDMLEERVNRYKAVVFELDKNSCNLKESCWDKVFMGGGLGKWRNTYFNENGEPILPGRTGHLPMILRESMCNPISWKSFGFVLKARTSLYIKPFAIWD
jgi:hypothetical protein